MSPGLGHGSGNRPIYPPRGVALAGLLPERLGQTAQHRHQPGRAGVVHLQGPCLGHIALTMAVANVVGSLLGTRLALKHGAGFMRLVFMGWSAR